MKADMAVVDMAVVDMEVGTNLETEIYYVEALCYEKNCEDEKRCRG